MFTDTKNRVLADGPSRLRKGLDAKRAEIENLEERIAVAADDEERARLEARLEELRAEIRAIDDRLPILSLRSLADQRDGSAELWLLRTGAQVLTALGAIALLLAVTGVYGVKSYVVSRRTREIGIRMALGARPLDVLVQLLRQGLSLALVGLGIGLVLSLIVAQLLSSALWEVSSTDPVTFVGASILLTLAALLATYLPSRRATRVTPTAALRHE